MRSHEADPPAEVRQAAEQRAAARAARDYATADRLKAQIEQSGWKVIDAGPSYRLEPAHRPNVEIDGVLHFGSSAGVPSRLGEPDAGPLTVVSVDAAPGPEGDPSIQWLAVFSQQPAELALGYERLLTDGPLGLAAAWNIGLRRAIGSRIVLLAPGLTIDGSRAALLAASLADESVAAAGSAGLNSPDMRRWHPAPPGEVDALDAQAICFRRRDAVRRGLLDERFGSARWLAIWWSLVLRDEGQDRPPRKAVCLDLELAPRSSDADEPQAGDRQARRDLYRLIDRFGRRLELLRESVRPTGASARARRQPR